MLLACDTSKSQPFDHGGHSWSRLAPSSYQRVKEWNGILDADPEVLRPMLPSDNNLDASCIKDGAGRGQRPIRPPGGSKCYPLTSSVDNVRRHVYI